MLWCIHTVGSLFILHIILFCCKIILSRESEVLELECEMSAVHGLLSKIPERLSYEQVIVMAQELFEKHPPRKLARNEGIKLHTR